MGYLSHRGTNFLLAAVNPEQVTAAQSSGSLRAVVPDFRPLFKDSKNGHTVLRSTVAAMTSAA